uniref:ATP synthase complex subunit 8 n=1 Tax=Omobranchus elongatus TaxID=1892335 RepID=A0A1D8BCS6_9TELE|nr:ATP synthase F0 subunit 8 [Omobranchus elongatus]
MPQLDPTPWLMISTISWATLLTFMPPKVMTHVFPNDPLPPLAKELKPKSWTW